MTVCGAAAAGEYPLLQTALGKAVLLYCKVPRMAPDKGEGE